MATNSALKSRATIVGLVTIGLAAAMPAKSQDVATNENLMRFAGSTHALAELCDLSTKARLVTAKDQQRQVAIKRGISAQRFEVLFAEGYKSSNRKIAAATPSQRSAACRQVRSLGAK